MHYKFKTIDCPDANGRAPIVGEELWTVTFPTDEGGKVEVVMGSEGRWNMIRMLGWEHRDDDADALANAVKNGAIPTPWSPYICDKLNEHQNNLALHPWTCGSGNRKDAAHLDHEGVLYATPNGWVCPYCDYRQKWFDSFLLAAVDNARAVFTDKPPAGRPRSCRWFRLHAWVPAPVTHGMRARGVRLARYCTKCGRFQVTKGHGWAHSCWIAPERKAP